jgi:hypothetical protein
MAKYVLIYSGGGMPETDAEQAAAFEAWGAWYGALGASVVDGGNPFLPYGRTIAGDGSVHDIAPTHLASGYTIIEAASLDEAIEKGKGCPILKNGGEVHVFEAIPMMNPE